MVWTLAAYAVAATQQLLDQGNFTAGAFADAAATVRLVGDVDAAASGFEHNATELRARLDGGGRRLSSAGALPLFRAVRSAVFNITIECLLAERADNASILLVTTMVKPFIEITHSTIEHLVLQSSLADALRNSNASDLKVVDSTPIAETLSNSSITALLYDFGSKIIQTPYLIANSVNDVIIDRLLFHAIQLHYNATNETSLFYFGNNLTIRNSHIYTS